MPNTSNYRWYILFLAALTMSLAVAVPGMCLPVLFDEISNDLDLSRTQIGVIWGIASLPRILIALIGGSIGDRFGPKRVLIAACLLSGVAGAARGLSVNFITLIGTGFIFGILAAVGSKKSRIPGGRQKIAAHFFAPFGHFGMIGIAGIELANL